MITKETEEKRLKKKKNIHRQRSPEQQAKQRAREKLKRQDPVFMAHRKEYEKQWREKNKEKKKQTKVEKVIFHQLDGYKQAFEEMIRIERGRGISFKKDTKKIK